MEVLNLFDINKYLIHLKRNFSIITENILKPSEILANCNIILGNSSCDMDSFLCSFLLSIFKNFFSFGKVKNIEEFLSSKNIFLPILNCRREDFCDRLDIYYLLNKYNINKDNFIFIDDLETRNLLNTIKNNSEQENLRNKFRVTLVDHNEIDKDILFLCDFVEEILDHHSDNFCKVQYRNIKKKSLCYPLGSCSSLIILENLGNFELNIKDDSNNILKIFFKDLFILVAAVILDTRNFLKDDFEVRWNNLDLLALEKVVDMNIKHFLTNEFNRENIYDKIKTFYDELLNSKYDEDANLTLGLNKLFNKDKKEFIYTKTKILWSSLQVNFEKIVEKFSLSTVENSLQDEMNGHLFYVFNYRKKVNEETCCFITLYLNQDFNEKFNDLQQKLRDFVKKEANNRFYSNASLDNKFIIFILDTSITRKNFEPIIKNFINSYN